MTDSLKKLAEEMRGPMAEDWGRRLDAMRERLLKEADEVAAPGLFNADNAWDCGHDHDALANALKSIAGEAEETE